MKDGDLPEKGTICLQFQDSAEIMALGISSQCPGGRPTPGLMSFHVPYLSRFFLNNIVIPPTPHPKAALGKGGRGREEEVGPSTDLSYLGKRGKRCLRSFAFPKAQAKQN